MTSPGGETIQGGTLFKGEQYRLEKGFDRGQTLFKGVHYLREDIN